MHTWPSRLLYHVNKNKMVVEDVMEDDTILDPHGVMLNFSDSGHAPGEINVPHKLYFHPDMLCLE